MLPGKASQERFPDTDPDRVEFQHQNTGGEMARAEEKGTCHITKGRKGKLY